MKRIIFFLAMCLLLGTASHAQDLWLTKTGHIYFMSHTDAIDIDGNNNQVTSFLNTSNGEIVFQLLIKSFTFTLATAEEHFNETYMESDKFPKASLKGVLANPETIDFGKNGTYPVVVKGELTIHGVTRTIEQAGEIVVEEGKISAKSSFTIAIDDYKIKVPKLVEDRVAKIVDVAVNMEYLPYKK